MFIESCSKSGLAPAERNVSFEAEGRAPNGTQIVGWNRGYKHSAALRPRYVEVCV